MRRVIFIQGGGVGSDQEAAIRRILQAAQVPVEFDVYLAGRAALEIGKPPLPPDMIDALRNCGLALKTRLHAPKGAATPTAHGPKQPENYNLSLRRALGLFASLRPIHNLPGLPSRFRNVNFLLIRELTEDLYTASEHELVPGVVQSFKVVTEAACLRFFRFAFETTRRYGRKTIHCIHKANILKMADGLYLDCFRRVAAEFPDIQPREMIVDNACMQLVSRPQQFEVLAAGNLYGDLLADLGAGLVGGVSATAAINYGQGVKVYESVYGAPHDVIPPDTANPLPLLLPTLELLKDLGEIVAAEKIEKAIAAVLCDTDIRTPDLGGNATTTALAQAIAERIS